MFNNLTYKRKDCFLNVTFIMNFKALFLILVLFLSGCFSYNWTLSDLCDDETYNSIRTFIDTKKLHSWCLEDTKCKGMYYMDIHNNITLFHYFLESNLNGIDYMEEELRKIICSNDIENTLKLVWLNRLTISQLNRPMCPSNHYLYVDPLKSPVGKCRCLDDKICNDDYHNQFFSTVLLSLIVGLMSFYLVFKVLDFRRWIRDDRGKKSYHTQ